MERAILTISSKNYSSWSLRGWLLCRMAGLEFDEQVLSIDDPSSRAELLHLSPSFLVPHLTHGGIKVWDTLAIAAYLHETFPQQVSCPKIVRRAPIASAFPARCIRALRICGPRYQ
jgi:glutathione S-transferase